MKHGTYCNVKIANHCNSIFKENLAYNIFRDTDCIETLNLEKYLGKGGEILNIKMGKSFDKYL